MEEQQPQIHSRRSYVYDSQGNRNKKKLFAIIGGVLIVIIIIVGASFAFSGDDNTTDEDIFATPAATQAPSSTPTPTPEVTPSEDETTTEEDTKEDTTAKADDTIDADSGLDRKEYSILIQNGSGTAGAAGRLADILGDLGYTVSGTENADNFDYTETEIHVANKNTKLLNLLTGDINDEYTIGDTSSDWDGDEDAVIIIGAE